VPLSALLKEVARPYEDEGKEIDVEEAGQGPEPVIRRTAPVLYGLGNLIENAADFARRRVTIAAHWDKSRVGITISDDGPGFPPDLMARLGDPYLTTRVHEAGEAEAPGGLGLGIFIAKTLLARSGATIALVIAGPDGGARVRIDWPRERIENR
jgi:two-component system sensor histidine kinase RegB